ncbi:hypothetical protein B0H13DRAFT_2508677 [Mycena leptocephala]|nr:hypothetical protein B0H13DRAFT_2508677 [Mycena leptocephala]
MEGKRNKTVSRHSAASHGGRFLPLRQTGGKNKIRKATSVDNESVRILEGIVFRKFQGQVCSTGSSALTSTAMVECSFPLELEQEIFETTAVRHPETIPTLLRVCHRVHIWIEPFLYRVLYFDNFNWDEPFLIAADSKPLVFLQIAVRHALIFDSTSGVTPRFHKLLLECTGIVNLAFDGTLLPGLLQALNKMHLLLLLRVAIVVTYNGSWDRDLAIGAFAHNIIFLDPSAVVMALATNYTIDWAHVAAKISGYVQRRSLLEDKPVKLTELATCLMRPPPQFLND